MADTIFRADFRGSWALETAGLKEEDSSVEIYTENILTGEAKHKHKHTRKHSKDENKHMHVNKQDSTGKGTDDRETEEKC